MHQSTGTLNRAQRKALAEGLQIAWYHIGHHQECYPFDDGCACDAASLKARLGRFDAWQFIESTSAFIHDGTLELFRLLPRFVGHSWRCSGAGCVGCHYPRLVQIGAEFGVSFEPRSWSAWWCDKCEKFFHSTPRSSDGSCCTGEACQAYRSIVRDYDLRNIPF